MAEDRVRRLFEGRNANAFKKSITSHWVAERTGTRGAIRRGQRRRSGDGIGGRLLFDGESGLCGIGLDRRGRPNVDGNDSPVVIVNSTPILKSHQCEAELIWHSVHP
jgi:hypothetical protein